MKPLTTLFISAACLALVAGCAAPQTYKQGPGAGSLTPIPDTTPQLGEPAQGFERGGDSSSYGPSDASGPTLGVPEASRGLPQTRLTSAPVSKRQTTRFRPATPAASPASSRTTIPAEPVWSRRHTSIRGRPIETLEIGRGNSRVAILGSLHGDETQSTELVEELARHLTRHPETLRETTVLLVKSPNPDGIAVHNPYNSRGVDLNRNFPSSNWKNLPNGRAGAQAASEAETQVVTRLLADFRPDLVVHLKDYHPKEGGRAGLINVEGSAEDRAERVSKLITCRVVSGLGAKTSGSLESFAVANLHCPALTLLLAPEANPETAWATNRSALVVLAAGADVAGENSGHPLNDADASDEPAMLNSSLRKRPAADPEFTGRSRSRDSSRLNSIGEFPSAIPERGYVELPPP